MGYHVYDSCNNVNKAIDNVLHILSGPGVTIPNYCCEKFGNLVGVIGDLNSDISLHIAELLNIYGYPQISYGPVDSIVSDLKRYPSLFQALPNYRTQCLAIIQLLRHYNWTWIGVIASDDDVGEKQSQEMKTMANSYDICIEYIIKILDTWHKIKNIADNSLEIFNNSTSQIVVICGKVSLAVIDFIEREDSNGHEKTFIVPADPTVNRLLKFSLFQLHECNKTIKLGELDDNIYYTESFGVTYLVYKSVYAMAYAVHEMQLYMQRNTEDKYKDIQILMQKFLRRVHFRDPLGKDINFNEKGEMSTLYYILNFACDNDEMFELTDVGYFNASSPEGNQIIPVSTCSEQCPPGYKRILKPGIHKCCFDCMKCSEGQISNETDSVSCNKCPEDQWPNDLNQCVPKIIEFLSYKNDPAVLIVSIVSVLCSVKTSIILGIFILFRDTPVVKANNQNLSFTLLVSIMLSFLCVFLFLGRPTHVTCMLRQPSFGIIFSVAISSILAKTIMVYTAFKATKPGSPWRKMIGVKITNCVVFFCSFLLVLLSIIWLSTSPPFPERNTHLYKDKIIFQCNEGSMLAFSILLGYMGLLAAVSFIVAFLARNLPDSFNEAKNITFSMLVVCSVWVAFIPAYMSVTGKNTVLVEIFAVISSSVGILGCIFVPKCFIILVRPDLNSKSSFSRQIQAKTQN
ncbi:vomeronasal type-2 receptor 26-like [Rhinoderma darwinii]|uniref:vomeronasal type-2 receptor 26-like n=1 Tax=Rhinoderma darwinii TaxID=43563 RepID=UPI003F668B71